MPVLDMRILDGGIRMIAIAVGENFSGMIQQKLFRILRARTILNKLKTPFKIPDPSVRIPL